MWDSSAALAPPLGATSRLLLRCLSAPAPHRPAASPDAHVCQVLPRALDDNTFAALNHLQFYNNVNIISTLCNDTAFFEQLRQKLWPPPPFDGEQAGLRAPSRRRARAAAARRR